MISREDLAAHIWPFLLAEDAEPRDAFVRADDFIAECERQKCEPKACEHQWVVVVDWSDDNVQTTVCKKCWTPKVKPLNTSQEPVKKSAECEHVYLAYPGPRGTVKMIHRCSICGDTKPEPPKPERVARTFRLVVYPNGNFERYSDDAMQYGTGAQAVMVKEILPGDEK